MIFVTYQSNGTEDWGILNQEKTRIIPKGQLRGGAAATLLEHIQSGDTSLLEPIEGFEAIGIGDVEILSPIPRPVRNILCVGKNYEDHVNELKHISQDNLESIRENPVFFTKATNTMNGPYSNVPLHAKTTALLDYEVELAVVVSRRCRDLSDSEAGEVIFGYTILNDISARDVQQSGSQWFRGKSLDGTCPMGPYLFTPDEIPDIANLRIRSLVNGEVRQDSSTSLMINSIPRLLSKLSQGLTLEAGDILATGTPSGVGMGFVPPKTLKDGDVVRAEVEIVGFIENRIVG